MSNTLTQTTAADTAVEDAFAADLADIETNWDADRPRLQASLVQTSPIVAEFYQAIATAS